jgi:Spy/CpxP family protein refolding chaperone
MSLRTTIAAALVIGLLSPVAFAQSAAVQRGPRPGLKHPDGITARQRLQQRRIEAGRKRGAISDAERSRLQARQQQIRALMQQLRSSGGRLDRRERLRLHRQLNQLSRAIRRAGRG